MSPSTLHASLLNPQGSHGSASGNANNDINPELSPLSRINISDSFNLFKHSPQTHVHQKIVVVEPSPEKKESSSSSSVLGTLLVLGAVTMVGAVIGACVALVVGRGKEGEKKEGGVMKLRVGGGVHGTLAAEMMGTAMEAPEGDLEEEAEADHV